MGARRRRSIDDLPQAAGASRPEVIAQTLAFWQPRTKRRLTSEDAREINQNLTGFFNILLEWDRADRAKRHRSKAHRKSLLNRI